MKPLNYLKNTAKLFPKMYKNMLKAQTEVASSFFFLNPQISKKEKFVSKPGISAVDVCHDWVLQANEREKNVDTWNTHRHL